jgi:hypothetical protein
MSKKTVTKKDLEKLAKKLGNVLTDKDLKKLETLGVKIRACLSCNINDTGVPCRTDRLEAVRLMQEYLLVHVIVPVPMPHLKQAQAQALWNDSKLAYFFKE